MITRALNQIRATGFQTIKGPNAWFFLEGVNQAAKTPRIHIGESIDYGDLELPGSMAIRFVAMGIHKNPERTLNLGSEVGHCKLPTLTICEVSQGLDLLPRYARKNTLNSKVIEFPEKGGRTYEPMQKRVIR